jgi:CHAT domain-containing protein
MFVLSDAAIGVSLIDDLLARDTLDQRVAFLRAASLFDADGLTGLVNTAAQLVGSDPGKARMMAQACAELAEAAGMPEVRAYANYICAQTHAIDAEFETALQLIDAARLGYLAAGSPFEALRTNAGRIYVLQELGRYQEALEIGEVVLEALDNSRNDGRSEVHADTAEVQLLASRIYQNQGVCYQKIGRYDDALAAYAAAKANYEALNMTESVGDIANNSGVVHLNLGHGREALAAFESAAAIFAAAGQTLKHAQSLINIGDAHLLLGHYSRGLAAFERARRLFGSLAAQSQQHVLLLDMADAYLALNLYPEALAAYREVDESLRAAGMLHDRARALWGMGSALMALSQLDEAQRVLAESATLFNAANNAPMLSSVLSKQAALLAMRGNRAAALAKAEEALAIVSGNDWPLQQVYAHLRIADLRLPDAAQVQQHLMQAGRLVERLNLPHLRYRLNQRLGHVHLLQGDLAQAESLLLAAMTEIETLRATVVEDRMRASFLADKLATYDDLMRIYLGRNDKRDVQRAFVVAERAKSRALVDMLSGIATGAARRSAASTHPDPFSATLSLPDIQDRLPPDAVLLSYYICGDDILAFVNIGRELHLAHNAHNPHRSARAGYVISSAATIQRLLRRLALQWERFRLGEHFVARNLLQVERSAQTILAALYDELVRPLEDLLHRASNRSTDSSVKLVIVPHGLLHQAPFHALFDGTRYLIDRFEISYAPSATVLALCQQRAAPPADKSFVAGVADPLIPAAQAEAQAVARHLSNAVVRLDSQATLCTVQNEAPGCQVIHLACHGFFRTGNPMFSSLKLHDGWLMAADAMQLDLNGALVTLSACESGRNQVIAGDEIMGLTRAFLSAGAAALVVSLWLAQDTTTAELMESFYRELEGGAGRAEALRRAQLALKERYTHPFYWAPFVLVGQR